MEEITFTFKDNPELTETEVLSLYSAVGQQNEVQQIKKLMQGIDRSYVLAAYHEKKLVGLLRAVTDDATIFFIQEMVIHPEYEHDNLDERFMAQVIQTFENIEQMMVAANLDDSTKQFYEQCGFKSFEDMNIRGFIRDIQSQ